MMIKKVITFCMAAIAFFIFSIPVFADTFNLSYSVDDNNSSVNILIDAMRNDMNYDPFNEYACFRSGENEYRIYFGEDLSAGNLVYYRLVPASYNTPATLSRGISQLPLTLNKGSYYYVGNVDGSLASQQFENYKYLFIVVISFAVLLVFIGFKLFRKSSGNKQKYYNV